MIVTEEDGENHTFWRVCRDIDCEYSPITLKWIGMSFTKKDILVHVPQYRNGTYLILSVLSLLFSIDGYKWVPFSASMFKRKDLINFHIA